ncbi:MAG: hypothetical protein DRH03_03825 [Deltaproteobacteria bacterium]|nr:MAG: hypothetical protein DRH03_03825 [Deltaproteobacteria bacterium]
MSIEELGNIDISIATRKNQSINDAPGIITVITRSEIFNQNPRNLSDILNLVPGFNVVVESLNASLIQLRATGNRQDSVLLLLDGHRLNNELFGGISYVINDIPVELVERIEIIRGPGSAIYGSNAFEAVINVITIPDNYQVGKNSSLYGRYGSDNSLHGGIIVKNRFNDFNVVASIAGDNSDGPTDDYTDKAAISGELNYDQEIYNFYTNINYGNFTVMAFYDKENVGPYIGIWKYLNERTDRTYETMAFEGRGDFDFNDYGNITARVYYNRFEYDCLWENLPPEVKSPNGFLKNPSAKDSRFGSELCYKKTFFEKHQIMIGGNFDQIKLFDSSLKQTDSHNPYEMVDIPGSWIDEDRNYHYSFYGQDQLDLFDEYKLTVGFRFDDYSKYGSSFSPRVGLVKSLGVWGDIKLLYGRSFRAPSYYESNTNANGGLIPNDNVDAERLESFEVEYSYIGSTFSGNLNAYYTKIKDLIGTARVAGGYTKTNLGEVKSFGIETEIRKSFFNDHHSLRVNGYLNHSVDGDNEHIKRVPNYGFNCILDDLWSECLSSNIQFRYTGRMKKESILDRNGEYLAFDDLSSTVTVNVSLIYDFGDLAFKTSIYNLFDENLNSPATSTLNSEGNPLQDYPYNRRFLMAGFEYNF